MKKLIALISPQGKTSKQLTDEVWTAFQKYKKVEKKVLDNMNSLKNDKNNLDKKEVIKNEIFEKVINHLESLGFRIEKHETRNNWFQCRIFHKGRNYLIRFNSLIGFTFMSDSFGLDYEKVRKNKLELLEVINQINNNTFFMTSTLRKDFEVMFSGWFPPQYTPDLLNDFLDLMRNDIDRNLSNLSKFLLYYSAKSVKEIPEEIWKVEETIKSLQNQTKHPGLTIDQLIQQSNEISKQRGHFNDQPSMPQGSMQVMFFGKTPKYQKNPINTSVETFETLWKYCTSNNRLCLKLKKWYDLWAILKNTRNLCHGGIREPAHPENIYYNWDSIMPIEKQFQFKRYIQWSSDNNQIEEVGKYVRSLSESDWAHYGEI